MTESELIWDPSSSTRIVKLHWNCSLPYQIHTHFMPYFLLLTKHKGDILSNLSSRKTDTARRCSYKISQRQFLREVKKIMKKSLKVAPKFSLLKKFWYLFSTQTHTCTGVIFWPWSDRSKISKYCPDRTHLRRLFAIMEMILYYLCFAETS